MSAPDLETDEGRAAYRKELRRVAWPLRWGGLLLVVLAAVWVVFFGGAGGNLLVVAYAMLALGWGMFLAATVLRTRHHKRRLAEGL